MPRGGLRRGVIAADLDRFIVAQEPVYEGALEELRHGRKTSHWMWFIFPQVAGLGPSPTAVYSAIRDRAEADASSSPRVRPALDSGVRSITSRRVPTTRGL